MAPRIAPLPREGRDPRTEELMAGLRGPDGSELNIFATLARHPKLFKRWVGFGGVLLYGGNLSPRDRELLILRTAIHCDAHYEWGQHVAIAQAAGLSEEEIARVAAGADADGWSSDDAAVIRAADELHADARISDPTWEVLAARLDDTQLIEVCMIVGQYHLVAFTLNSLGVEGEGDLPEMPPVTDLTGRRVLVVGAGTRVTDDPDAPVGNGRAISVVAGRAGATVACADLDGDAAAATAALVEAEGATAHVLTADVSDADACAELVAAADDAMGGIDGLVLNIGIGAGMGMRGTTAAQWDQVFAVNVRSHFLLSAAALPRMSAGGAIVFISSIAGLMPGSRIPAYDSSKSALTGLCRQVAAEGARRGVRANVVAPGLIDTPLGRAASGGRPSRDKAPVPLGRQGTAWEVAEPVVFLLSDHASYITSQLLAVDGGLTGCRG